MESDFANIPTPLALRIAQLALRPQTWIHRHVEQVCYLDRQTTRRWHSIDFTVPAVDPEADEPVTARFVPLARIAKADLIDFDLRDEQGTALPMLTSEQNWAVSAALLRALAELHAPGLQDPILDGAITDLVLTRNPAVRERAWARIFDQRTTLGRQLLAPPDPAFPNVPSNFAVIALELARDFYLYVPCEPDQHGQRRIVKLAYNTRETAPRPGSLGERLGWSAIEGSFQVPLAGWANSYHFELLAPGGTEILAGDFAARSHGEERHDGLLGPTSRGHFRLSQLDRRTGRVDVRLRAADGALALGTLLLSAITVAVLFAFKQHLATITNPADLAAVDPVLLALPGLFIVYLVRPGEHAILTDFLAGLRWVALASGLSGFAAAVVLCLGLDPKRLHAWLLALTIVAAAATAVLAVAWLCQRRAPRERRVGVLDFNP